MYQDDTHNIAKIHVDQRHDSKLLEKKSLPSLTKIAGKFLLGTPSVLVAFLVIDSYTSDRISSVSILETRRTRSTSFSILLIITGRNHHAEKQWTSHGHAPTIDAYNYRRNRLHAISSREQCEPWKDIRYNTRPWAYRGRECVIKNATSKTKNSTR